MKSTGFSLSIRQLYEKEDPVPLSNIIFKRILYKSFSGLRNLESPQFTVILSNNYKSSLLHLILLSS